MEFTNIPPKWDAAGAEPSVDLQTKGFTAGYKPPAAYFNYLFHTITECLKELQTVAIKTNNGLSNFALEKFTSKDAAEIETYLNGISENMGANVAYRRALHVDAANYVLKGGTWLIEGYKYSATYEWQQATSYGGTCAYIYTRSKYMGTWGAWTKAATNEAELVLASSIEKALNSTSTNPVANSTIYNALNEFKHIGYTSDNTDELNNYLDTISTDMPESTSYTRRLVANTSSFYLKSGGTWVIEGFKQSATYEWQIAIKWVTTGVYIRTRSKISGTWQEWHDIYTSGTTITGLATKDKTLVGAINEISRLPVTATSTDGVAYTATVAGVTELYNGLEITIIPNKTSTAKNITLDINGLGAKSVRLPLSFNNAAMSLPKLDTYYVEGRPLKLMFDEEYIAGGMWKVQGKQYTSAQDLYGVTPIESGGTGGDTAADARANLEVYSKAEVDSLLGDINAVLETLIG